MTKHFVFKSVISSIEIYDKHIIVCNFSYHALYQPIDSRADIMTYGW